MCSFRQRQRWRKHEEFSKDLDCKVNQVAGVYYDSTADIVYTPAFFVSVPFILIKQILKLKEEAISTESVIEQSKLRKRIERLEAQKSESTQKILILRETISASENAVEKLKEEYELMEDSLLKKLITGNKSAAKTLL